jgi:hypothetical protein
VKAHVLHGPDFCTEVHVHITSEASSAQDDFFPHLKVPSNVF